MANAVVIRTRIELAKNLIKKLTTHMTITSANRGMALVTDKVGLTDHASDVQTVYNVWTANPDFVGVHSPNANVVGSSVDEAHGNCDMRAEITYQLAYNRPRSAAGTGTKMAKVVINGHAFCILCDDGLPAPIGGGSAIGTFGEDAVVCDGWQEDYYAPNVRWVYGRVPGPEAFVWRKKIAANNITIQKEFTFVL